MERRVQLIERLAGLIVGMALVVIGFFLAILGLTLLPITGILLAIPVMSMSLYFLIPELRVQGAEKRLEAIYEEHDTWCPWPPVLYH